MRGEPRSNRDRDPDAPTDSHARPVILALPFPDSSLGHTHSPTHTRHLSDSDHPYSDEQRLSDSDASPDRYSDTNPDRHTDFPASADAGRRTHRDPLI